MKKNIAIIAVLGMISITASVASSETEKLDLDLKTQKTTLAPSPNIQQQSSVNDASNALPSQNDQPEEPLHPLKEWLARVTFKAVCKVIGFTPPPLQSKL